MLSFPVQPLTPLAGVDASWQAGLALAQEQGLHFGRDIVFTYGPLGFLATPQLFVVWSGLVALAFALLVQVLLCRTVLHVARDLPALVALVVTYVIAVAAPSGAQGEIGAAIVLALSLSVLLDGERRVPSWFPVAGGVAAGVLVLIKPTTGALALALVAAAVGICGSARLRRLGELAAGFAVSFTGLWLATGNNASDIVPWLRGSAQLVAGYTAGMAYEDPAKHHELVEAGLLLVVTAALVWRVAAGLPRSRRRALALVWAIGAFVMLKQGFVRHDGHSATFFFSAALAGAALARGGIARIAGAGIAVVASIWALAAFGVHASALFQYTDRLDGTAAELKLVVNGSDRNAMRSDARATMLRSLRLPSNVLRDLRAHTVDVQPTETTAAWTLGLHWRPEPDFQSYAVLTPALDRLNADFLASARAPERVLRVNPLYSIDERNPVFDAPNAFLSLVCNYRQTYANGVVEVLVHAGNRCGAPRRLGGLTLATGQAARVPRAGRHELVFARIEIRTPFGDRLRELLWKPAHIPAIVLDGRSYRLVAANASGPLLMRMPASAGFASSGLRAAQVNTVRIEGLPIRSARLLRGPRRLRLRAAQLNTVRIEGLPTPLRVDFYAVRVG